MSSDKKILEEPKKDDLGKDQEVPEIEMPEDMSLRVPKVPFHTSIGDIIDNPPYSTGRSILREAISYSKNIIDYETIPELLESLSEESKKAADYLNKEFPKDSYKKKEGSSEPPK